MSKPIDSVIKAANALGVLCDHPHLPREAGDVARRIYAEADIDGLIREHAALVAVAKAASDWKTKRGLEQLRAGRMLTKALTDLDTIQHDNKQIK